MHCRNDNNGATRNMSRQIQTTVVPKNEYKNYWEKGNQFYNVMIMCLQDSEWDAVLLNGVHACISANDALAVFYLGKRSISKSHQDATQLLLQAPLKEEGRKNAARLSEILNLKHQIEYEPRRFTEKDAHDFAKKVERFILWAKEKLPL